MKLSQMFASCSTSSFSLNQTSVATNQQNDLCNKQEMLHQFQPGEADYRLLLHACDPSRYWFRNLSVININKCRCNHIVPFFSLHFNQLWVEFGTGYRRKYIPIHETARFIDEKICRAMSFWFSSTGCDRWQFAGRRKQTAWQSWENFCETTETFASRVDLFIRKKIHTNSANFS